MAHEILEPIYCRSDERGTFQELISDYKWESVITGTMHTGSKMGNHYHKRTLIFFFLLNGSARVRTLNIKSGDKDSSLLGNGQGILLCPFQTHEILFLQESSFLMLKSIKYTPEDPDTFPYPVPDE